MRQGLTISNTYNEISVKTIYFNTQPDPTQKITQMFYISCHGMSIQLLVEVHTTVFDEDVTSETCIILQGPD